MQYTNCLYGSRLKADAPEWFAITQDAVQNWGYTSASRLWPVLLGLCGTTIALRALAENPRPQDPNWDDWYNWNGTQTREAVLRWVYCWLWDTFAECIPDPDGCMYTFTPTHQDMQELNRANATVHGSGGSGGPVTIVGHSYLAGGPGGGLTAPGPVVAGDIVLVLAAKFEGSGLISAPAPWQVVGRVQGSTSSSAVFWARREHATTWPEHFTMTGGYWQISCWQLRGCDPVAPVLGFYTHAGACNMPFTMPSVGGYEGGLAVGQWTVYTGVNFDLTPDVVPDVSVALSGVCWRGASVEYALAGDLPSVTLSAPYGSLGLQLSSVVLQPVGGVSTGEHLTWHVPSPTPLAWGVLDATQPEPPAYYEGGVDDGLDVSYEYPAALGGTLAGNECHWMIHNLAHTSENFINQVGGPNPVLLYHPCNVAALPVAIPPDPPGWVAPTIPPAATLEGIAAALDYLERKLDNLTQAVFEIGVPLADWFKPYFGSFGQAGEPITGLFPDVVVGALRAMSNYTPLGYGSVTPIEGLTGESEVVGPFAAYRVRMTTIPAWAGSRGGNTRLYEVNSRAQQLGWYAFRTGGGLLDWRPLTWYDGVVTSQDGLAGGLYLYLQEGVVASVQGLVRYYDPVLPEIIE